MDLNNIKELLDKYWEANASLEEEAQLRAYFAQDVVAEELKAFQPMFQHFTAGQATTVSDDFEDRLNERLADVSIAAPKTKMRTLMIRMAAAATIALMILASVKYCNQSMDKVPASDSRMYAESTLFESDAERQEALAAYEQTKAALLLVSSKMKKGSDQATKNIVRVNKSRTILQ